MRDLVEQANRMLMNSEPVTDPGLLVKRLRKRAGELDEMAGEEGSRFNFSMETLYSQSATRHRDLADKLQA